MQVAATIVAAHGGNASMRMGTVTDYDQASGQVSVDVGGGSLIECPYASRYIPTIDDQVIMMSVGSAWVVIDSVGTATPPLTPQIASIPQLESTTSGSFVDLATPGPSVPVNVPATGRVLVHFGAQIGWSDNTTDGAMGGIVAVAASGANVIAEDDNWTARAYTQVGGTTFTVFNATVSQYRLFENLAQGLTTFKLRYRVLTAGKKGDFNKRSIVAIPF